MLLQIIAVCTIPMHVQRLKEKYLSIFVCQILRISYLIDMTMTMDVYAN